MSSSIRLLYNRLYYACFYAAKAALLALDEEPKTHKGTANLLFQVLYQERKDISKETASFFSKIQRKREESDYLLNFNDDEADLKETEDEARKFINEIKRAIETYK